MYDSKLFKAGRWGYLAELSSVQSHQGAQDEASQARGFDLCAGVRGSRIRPDGAECLCRHTRQGQADQHEFAGRGKDAQRGRGRRHAPVDFSVNLALADPQGAASWQGRVHPGTATYGHYITAAQWEARFGSTAQTVQNVTQFLKSNGFTVGDVPTDRLFVPASGTAAQIEKTFGTSLSYHQVAGSKEQLATENLSVPANLAGQIAGFSGINQMNMRPTDTTGGPVQQPAATNGSNIPQPPGFRVATPCGQYANQTYDTVLPAVRSRLSVAGSVGRVRLHAAAVPQRLRPDRPGRRQPA